MRNTIIVALLAISACGCAFSSANVDLTYAPQTGVAALPEADGVTVTVDVRDQRIDRSNTVGSKKNGLGMETAPILANEDVLTTLRRAVEGELRARGFAVAGKATVSVTIDLVRFWNEFKIGVVATDAVADLQMTVGVSARGAIAYYRSIQAQGAERDILVPGGDDARLALNDALVKGMQALFDDPAFVAAIVAASKTTP
jgi:uncharacterized lipoprotein